MKRYHILLIIVVALFLRIWGLGFGLPFDLHQDEPIVVNHALAYGVGDFNPHFFIVPPFCSYVLFFFYAAFFVIGKIIGLFPGVEDFALSFFKDPSSFYLIARVVLGVMPSVISVWLVSVLYRNLFSKKGAWYSALIMALSFLNVINGHYAYVDNVMVMFILAVYVMLINILKAPTVRNYVLAGLLLGFAISTKYNAAILVVSCYLVHVSVFVSYGLNKKKLFFDGRLIAALFAAVFGIILTNPFMVLDWGFFHESLFGKIGHTYMGVMHHIYYSFFQGVGVLPLVLGVIGGIAILLREKWTKSLFLLSFPVIFYIHLILVSQRFSRYVLPLIPFIAIGAGYLFYEICFPKLKNRLYKVIVISLSFVILIPTTLKSFKACSLFAGEDTRVVSAHWIEANIPDLDKIAVDHTSFRPQISQTKEQIQSKKKIAGFQEGLGDAKEKKIEFMVRALEGEKTYNVYFLTMKGETTGQFLSTVPTISHDMDVLRKEGIEYVVINLNSSSEVETAFMNVLEREGKVFAEFSPYIDESIRVPDDRIDMTFMSVASGELYPRKMTGPCIVIYKIQE